MKKFLFTLGWMVWVILIVKAARYYGVVAGSSANGEAYVQYQEAAEQPAGAKEPVMEKVTYPSDHYMAAIDANVENGTIRTVMSLLTMMFTRTGWDQGTMLEVTDSLWRALGLTFVAALVYWLWIRKFIKPAFMRKLTRDNKERWDTPLTYEVLYSEGVCVVIAEIVFFTTVATKTGRGTFWMVMMAITMVIVELIRLALHKVLIGKDGDTIRRAAENYARQVKLAKERRQKSNEFKPAPLVRIKRFLRRKLGRDRNQVRR